MDGGCGSKKIEVKLYRTVLHGAYLKCDNLKKSKRTRVAYFINKFCSFSDSLEGTDHFSACHYGTIRYASNTVLIIPQSLLDENKECSTAFVTLVTLLQYKLSTSGSSRDPPL
jgi:hypothetical protein